MRTAAACLFLTLSPSVLPGATGYSQHNLVSDVLGAADFTDPNLVNAWGIVASATGPFWTCDGGTGLSTVYTVNNAPTAVAFGTPSATTKPSVPGPGATANGTCTGIVANSLTTGFLFNSPANPTPRPASFIFVTEEGTVSAWANAVDPAHAILLVDNSDKAVYKGLAIATTPTPRLYAADFKSGAIDVFDGDFKPVTLASGAFTDPNLPAGFAPFNIWNINGTLYVTFAKQDAAKKFDVPGVGNGVVDAYDLDGKLLKRVVSNVAASRLNSPWGVAIAPGTFGKFANALLVGNFGDGLINAFDANTGTYLGALQDAGGRDISIPGLWALYFGNGGSGGDKDTLYFTAGPSSQKHGLLGSIQANPNVANNGLVNAAQPAAGIAANTYITIKGTNLAATRRSWQAADIKANKLPTSLDGVTVTINGEPAFIAYISPVQINVLTPVDLPASGQLSIQMSNNGLTSGTINMQAQAIAPAFFLFNGDKYVAATHSDGRSLIGPATLFPNASTPAAPNETIVIYANGAGRTSPSPPNGELVTSPAALIATPIVQINNVDANVVFAGISATGIYQFNVTVPAGLPDGDVPVTAQIGAVKTPAGALITIRNQSQ